MIKNEKLGELIQIIEEEKEGIFLGLKSVQQQLKNMDLKSYFRNDYIVQLKALKQAIKELKKNITKQTYDQTQKLQKTKKQDLKNMQRIEGLQNQNRQLKQQMEDKENTIKQIQQEFETKKQKLKTKKQKIIELQKEILSTKQAYDTANQSIEQKSLQMQQLNDQVDKKVQEAIFYAQKDIEQQKQQFELAISNNNIQTQQLIAEKETIISQINLKLFEQQKLNQELYEKIQTLESTISILRQASKEELLLTDELVHSDINQNKYMSFDEKNLEEIDQNIYITRFKHEEILQNKILELKNQFYENMQKNNQQIIKNQVSKVENEFKQKIDEISKKKQFAETELEKTIDKFNQKNLQLEQILEQQKQYKQTLQQLNDKLQKSSQDFEIIRKELDNSNQQRNKLQKLNDELIEEKKQLLQKNNELNDTKHKLFKSYEEIQKKVNEKSQENSLMIDQQKSNQNQLQNISFENEQLKEQVDKLEKSLQDKSAVCNKLEQQKQNLARENENQLNKFQKQINTMQDLQKQIDNSQLKINNLQELLEQYHNQKQQYLQIIQNSKNLENIKQQNEDFLKQYSLKLNYFKINILKYVDKIKKEFQHNIDVIYQFKKSIKKQVQIFFRTIIKNNKIKNKQQIKYQCFVYQQKLQKAKFENQKKINQFESTIDIKNQEKKLIDQQLDQMEKTQQDVYTQLQQSKEKNEKLFQKNEKQQQDIQENQLLIKQLQLKIQISEDQKLKMQKEHQSQLENQTNHFRIQNQNLQKQLTKYQESIQNKNKQAFKKLRQQLMNQIELIKIYEDDYKNYKKNNSQKIAILTEENKKLSHDLIYQQNQNQKIQKKSLKLIDEYEDQIRQLVNALENQNRSTTKKDKKYFTKSAKNKLKQFFQKILIILIYFQLNSLVFIMIINPRDNTIVISEVTNFPTVTLQNGVIIYFEVQNTNNLQIDKRSKIKVNVSKRDRNGSFVKGGNYVNQGVLYSLNNQSNPQAKRRLSPNLFEAVQKMHQGDIGWILLNPQNDASVDKDIFVRIEVIDVEQIKISFPELPYQEQLEMIEEYKKKADALFLEALNIDDETIRNENLKKSYEEYKQGATYFLQIPKKKVKLFDKQTATNHYDFGAKIYNNYCKCMYKLKMNEQALEQISIFEKILRQKKMPFLLKILKTKAIIYQKTKNDKLNETVEEILQQEQNPSEMKFYQNMIKPVIKENPKVNKAFYKALRNAEKEDHRESVMKKVDLNIEFAELNVQENENQVIIDSSDDEEESFEVANDDETSA